MIEVIYKGEQKKGKKQDKQLELPKNIRQIGEGGDKLKIYMEDYVITYMHQITETTGEKPVTAVLLGETKEKDNCRYVFINGVLDVENIDFDEKVWEQIHENMDKFFPEREILGWFRGEEETTLIVSDDLSRIHMNQFPGEDKLLIIRDATEKESAIFVWENGKPELQKGYYIYFDKNTAMQEYMVSRNEGRSVETEKNIKDEAIQSFRKIVGEKKDEGKKKPFATRLLYAASSLLVLTVMIVGVTMINNYDKMKKMELTLVNLSETINAKNNSRETDVVSAMANTKNLETEGQSESLTGDVANKETESDQVQKQTDTEAETAKQANAAVERSGQASYVIKEGDTLATVSELYYGTMDKVQEICELNGITDKNHVLPGQKIVLP